MAGDVMAGKTLTVYLAADLKKFNKGIKQGETGLKGFGQSMSKYLGPALIAAGAAAGAFAVKLGVDAVGAASDLMETQNKVGVIFGNSSDAVLEFGDTAVTALGQTRVQALEASATFAQFGKSAGLSGASLVNFSTELVTLSADLASFNNSSPEDAINAIGSALRGEAEPMRRFGVLMDDAALKAQAMAMGIFDGNGALSTQQKVLAAHKVILAQTTDAQGDFARTSDGLANTQRILAAAVEDAKAEIGEGLVDALEAATGAMGGAGGMADSISTAGVFVGDLTRGVGLLIGEMEDLVDGLGNQTDATEDATEDSTLLNSALGLLRVSYGLATFGASEAAIAIAESGSEMRIAADAADSLYDSTIALAQAQRAQAYEEKLAKADNIASAHDSGIARLQEADRTARLTKILGHVPGVLDDATDAQKRNTNGSGRASDATENLTKKQEALLKTNEVLSASYSQTATDLTNQIGLLEDAAGSVRDYASSIQGNLLAGIDFEAAYSGQFDQAGQATGISLIEGFNKQIEQATYFGNVLTAIKAQGADQSLIEQIASLGPITGSALATQLLEDGLVPTMNDKWNSVQETTAGLAMGLVPEFLHAGVTSGIETVNGLAEQLSKEGGRLTKIGKKIAKPVGASFKAQLAKDVAEAIRSVEAAGTAARAEKVAQAEAQQAAITAQAVGLALSKLIRNSDSRSGAAVQPVLT
tara:strand:- start:437 stop:2545 length:2109 start_codon:yes stop_codon:yes gene_type:complete